MKKNGIRCLAGCFFLIVALTGAALLTPFLYDGHTINRLLFDLIIHTRKLNTDLDVNEIVVDGTNAYQCKAEDWWLASINSEALAKKEYFPNVSISTAVNQRHAAILGSNVTPESVENDEPLYIIIYSLRGYNIARLRFTTLPITTLTTDGTPTFEDDIPIKLNEFHGTAHLRGQSTQFFRKRSYRITLDEKQSILGMRNDDDWILYAAYNDQEKIRNVFSSNLWYNSCSGNNQFGVENGYEYRYTELFLNGNYAGLYALGYKPDQKQFNIQDGEYLFSKAGWADNAYELHGSKTKNNEASAWIALNSDYLYDESSSIDLWLFTNLCVAVDNTGKNYYFALKKNSRHELTAVYSPWDLDLSWGNTYNPDDSQNYTEEYIIPTDYLCLMGNGFVSQLIEDGNEAIIDRIKNRYKNLRSTYWSNDSLIGEVEKYEEDIFLSGAYRRDITTWPECSQQKPELRLSLFREYLLERLTWMDYYIKNLSPVLSGIEFSKEVQQSYLPNNN